MKCYNSCDMELFKPKMRERTKFLTSGAERTVSPTKESTISGDSDKAIVRKRQASRLVRLVTDFEGVTSEFPEKKRKQYKAAHEAAIGPKQRAEEIDWGSVYLD